MMNLENIISKGLQIIPLSRGDYSHRVYMEDTGWFLIKSITDLSPKRFEEEIGRYNERVLKANEWEIEYWDKVNELRVNGMLPKEQIYFTADNHFAHGTPNGGGILSHHPERGFTDIREHDNYWIEKWNNTISKKDVVYILGDFYWKNRVGAVALLHKLNGKKHMILGNHDKAVQNIDNLFQSISEIKSIRLKKEMYPYFVDFEFIITMCHYPMVSFYQKHRNSIQCHGHVHSNLDKFNTRSIDLRVDVGVDGSFAKSCGGFVNIEQLYAHYQKKRILNDYLLTNI